MEQYNNIITKYDEIMDKLINEIFKILKPIIDKGIEIYIILKLQYNYNNQPKLITYNGTLRVGQ